MRSHLPHDACRMRVRLELSSRCIGPGHLALTAAMIGEDGERSPQAEAVMWSFGVVPHDPVEQAIVEGGEVIEQQGLAVVDELFLAGSVEALAMRVHSRGARVGVPMGEALGVQSGAEVFSEL